MAVTSETFTGYVFSYVNSGTGSFTPYQSQNPSYNLTASSSISTHDDFGPNIPPGDGIYLTYDGTISTPRTESYVGYYLDGTVQHPLTLSGGVLTLLGETDAARTYIIQAADYTQGTYTPEPVACYSRGTRIRTVRGEIAVEELQIGDLARTFGGQGALHKPVRWLGYRNLDMRRHPDPENTHPIRFRAGALGVNRPCRDLLVSPGHRMRIGHELVRALELVNGATIVQESPNDAEYWHIELDGHDLVLAEGVEAETYLDTGNRAAFENCTVMALHSKLDGAVPKPCLPYAGASSAMRASLIARAEEMGWRRSTDPAPGIDVEGKWVEPVREGDRCRFILPAASLSVRLCSRVARPWDVDAHSGDRRQLGLKLHRLAIGWPGKMTEVALDSPALCEGFNAVEHDAEGRVWRWTTGDTPLDLRRLMSGQAVTTLEIDYDQALPMWVESLQKDI